MTHASELSLRRLFAGENVAADLKAHAEACEDCRTRLRGIEEEQRKFEAAIPFERFVAGVERASRNPREVTRKGRAWLRYALALAAGVVVVASVPALFGGHPINRIKGSGDIDVKVAGPANGPQRSASSDPSTPEALSPGERVRIGYSAGSAHHFVMVVSVDERGEVTLAYPSTRALGEGRTFLPDSLEFTGRGLERVIVILSPETLSVDEVQRALRIRYDEAHGNIRQLGKLELPGEEFHRMFLKP